MVDHAYIAHLHQLEVFFVAGLVVIIAVLAAGISAVAHRKWPGRSVHQLAMFTILVLAVSFFALTVGWLVWLMSAPCPENSACDAGAMAAAGAVMFGGIELIAVIAVGFPVAVLTVRTLRRR